MAPLNQRPYSTPASTSTSSSKRVHNLVWRRNPNPNPSPTGGNGAVPTPNGGGTQSRLVWLRNPNSSTFGGNSTRPNGGDHSRLVWLRNPNPNRTGNHNGSRPNPKGGNHNLVWKRNPNPSTRGNDGAAPDGGKLPKLCGRGENTNTERSIGCSSTSKGGTPCMLLEGSVVRKDFSLVATLEGHQKSIASIQLQSDNLYSMGYDGTFETWNCNSGQCAATVDMRSEVGCMLSVAPWLFVGMRNCVKVLL